MQNISRRNIKKERVNSPVYRNKLRAKTVRWNLSVCLVGLEFKSSFKLKDGWKYEGSYFVRYFVSESNIKVQFVEYLSRKLLMILVLKIRDWIGLITLK